MFHQSISQIFVLLLTCSALCLTGVTGCGTSKLTNTTRTATEQLLISDAMDRAVSQVNFTMLNGKKIYINSKPIEKVTDYQYLQSLVRQHALASGCLLEEEEENAEIIVELRAGTSGTDQNDTLFGISEMTIPSIAGYSATTIPEVALAKRTIQKATVKIGIFAYTREGHRPVWQSGNLLAESKAKNRWFFGMGPYQTGDIYEKNTFDGKEVVIPLIDTTVPPEEKEFISVGTQAFFRRNLEAEEKEKKEREEKEKAEAEKKKAEEAAAATAKEGDKKTDETAQTSQTAQATAPQIAAAPAPTIVTPAPMVGERAVLPPPEFSALNPPPVQ